MKFDTAKATILILLIGEGAGVFAGFCPSWFTVASPFFHEQAARDGNVKRIRAGEVAATAIVMGTGWAVSTGEVGPFAIGASAAICAVFIAGYEYQIRHPSKETQAVTPAAVPASAGSSSMLAWDDVT